MNRFIDFKYETKPFPVDVNTQTNQSLSLDEALEPILSQFDQLKPFIEKAKKLHRRPAEGNLTEHESAAIYLYTDNCEGQSLHNALNLALQSGSEESIKPWLKFMKLLYDALEKLPSVKCTVWRGLPTNLIKRLNENNEVVCWGFTSCSTSVDIIKSISEQNVVLCSIEPLNGKNIHEYSALEGDHETLFLPNTRLLVKRKGLNAGPDTPRLSFEEISNIIEEPTSPMDVPMESPSGSTHEEEIGDDHHQTTTDAVVTFINGDRYSLKYECGKRRGHGKYESIDQITYHDKTADEKATGEGICSYQNGDRFIGTFEKGLKNGHGILHEANGSIKVGAWQNDQPTNEDLQNLTIGTVYQWRDSEDNERWYGVFDDANGNKYVGNILDGKAERLGIRFWSNGHRYEGYFTNDKKHGYGVYYYTEKDRYAGQWMNDEIEGHGIFTWSSGTIYRGDFINGERDGKGKLIDAAGKVQEGQWRNDRYLSEMIH